MKGPLAMESLPPGTQNICERKRLYEDHSERKKSVEIDRGGKLDQMPTWKRDLLKRRKQQSKPIEQTLVINNDHVFAETNNNIRSDGVILSPVDSVPSPHDSSFESKLSSSYPNYSPSGKLLVDQEKIGSVLDNPFFKSDGKKAVLTRHNSSGDYSEPTILNHSVDDDDSSSETEEIYKPGSGFVHKLHKKFSRLGSREPEPVILRKRSASLENILDDKIVDKEKNRLSGAKLLNDEQNFTDRGRAADRRLTRTSSTDSASPSDRTRSPRDRSDSRTRRRTDSDAPDINLAKDIILVETSPPAPSLQDVSPGAQFVHIYSLTTEQEPEDDLPRQNVVSSTRSKFEHNDDKKFMNGALFSGVASTVKPNPVITTIANTMPITTVSSFAVNAATTPSTVVTQSNQPNFHSAENNSITETSVNSINHSNVIVNDTKKSNNNDMKSFNEEIDFISNNNLITSTNVVVNKPQINPQEVEIIRTDTDGISPVPDKESINNEPGKAFTMQDKISKGQHEGKKDVKKRPPKPPVTPLNKMGPVSVSTSNANDKPKTEPVSVSASNATNTPNAKDIEDTVADDLVQIKAIPDNLSIDNNLPIKGVPSILMERNIKKDPRNATSSYTSTKNMTELQHDVDEIRREGKTWSFGSETKMSASEATPQSSFRSNLKKSASDSGTVIFSSKDMALGKDVVPNRKRTAPNPPAVAPVTSIDDLIFNGSKTYNEIVPRLDLSFTNDSTENHMYQEGYIPSKIEPCRYKFIGAEVRLEHSSLKSSRTKKVRFEDKFTINWHT